MPPPTDFCVVFCTCPDQTVAEGIARHLLEARLAACVNVVPAIRSFYWWQDEIQTDEELLLVIKTHHRCYPELEGAISAKHPYEVPEIICLPVDAGLPAYLDWLGAALRAS